MNPIKSKSIALNAILNGLKTIITILFPLIIFPYVTRVLSVDNLGKVTYAQSIISYFILIAGLGINTYAVREGVKVIREKDKLERFSNQVFTISVISTIVSYVLLVVLLLLVKKFAEYSTVILILSSSIIFTTIGIEWMNSVFEDYLYITIRTLIVQCLHLVLVFLFINRKEDYLRYAFLIALSQILIGTINFFYCRRFCKVRLTKTIDFNRHIKPMLILFANSVAVTLYCNADSTMLGLMTSDYYVGIYAVAVKVFSMVRSLLAALLLVSIPRLSAIIGEGDKETTKNLVSTIARGILLLLLPAVTGLICLARPIVLILSGMEYLESILTLRILSMALVFAIIGGIVTNCVNIPTGKEKINLEATVLAALINIGLNFLAISNWKQNGAAVTTIIAEFTVIFYCCIRNREIITFFEWKKVGISFLHSSFGCALVIVFTTVVNCLVNNLIVGCIIIFVLSVISYGVFLIAVKDELVVDVLSKVAKKIKRR